jgi:hypothetical protein
MLHYAEKKYSAIALDTIRAGSVPLPTPPTPQPKCGVTSEQSPQFVQWSGDHAALKKRLEDRCTRAGDTLPRGKTKSGTNGGMYREGVKWAVEEIHLGRLPKSGGQHRKFYLKSESMY